MVELSNVPANIVLASVLRALQIAITVATLKPQAPLQVN